MLAILPGKIIHFSIQRHIALRGVLHHSVVRRIGTILNSVFFPSQMFRKLEYDRKIDHNFFSILMFPRSVDDGFLNNCVYNGPSATHRCENYFPSVHR